MQLMWCCFEIKHLSTIVLLHLINLSITLLPSQISKAHACFVRKTSQNYEANVKRLIKLHLNLREELIDGH